MLNSLSKSARIASLSLAALLAGCASHGGAASSAPTAPTVDPIVDRIEAAANAPAWRSHKAVRADCTAQFGGAKMFDGVITFTTDGGRSRLEWRSGPVAVFDGTTAWVTSQDVPRARFQTLTWPYFATAPYKLRDAGATVAPIAPKPVRPGYAPVPTWQLTFAPGVGDATDFYYLFPDPTTGRLTSMAYTVSFGKTQAEASKQLYAVVYSDYQDVDGVPFPHRFSFHTYDPATGIDPTVRGTAVLANVRFVDPPEGTFAKPDGSTEATVPPVAAAK